MTCVDGVARKTDYHDLPLVHRILSYRAFVSGFFSMANTICRILLVIPFFHSKGCCPSTLDNFGFGYLLPFASCIYLKPRDASFTILKGIELSRKLERALMNRVEGKTNDLVSRNLGNSQGINSLLLLSQRRIHQSKGSKR